MPKVCFNCFNIYSDYYNLESCPNIHCPYIELIDVDDMFVDVIIKLSMFEFAITGCCSGHLYEEYFEPYLSFQILKEYRDELEQQREIFIKHNKKENIVIKEIENTALNGNEDYCSFKIYPKVDKNVKHSIMEWKIRIKIQYEFLGFLYGIADELEKKINN